MRFVSRGGAVALHWLLILCACAKEDAETPKQREAGTAETCVAETGLSGGSLDAPDSFDTPILIDTSCAPGEGRDADSETCHPLDGRWSGEVLIPQTTSPSGAVFKSSRRSYALVLTTTAARAFTGSAEPLMTGGGRYEPYNTTRPILWGEFEDAAALTATLAYRIEGPDILGPNGGFVSTSVPQQYAFAGSYTGDRMEGSFRDAAVPDPYLIKLCRDGSRCCLPRLQYGIFVNLDDPIDYRQVPCDAVVIARDGDHVETLEPVHCRTYRGARRRPGTYSVVVTAAGYKPYKTVITANADCNRCNLLVHENNLTTLSLTREP